MSKKTHDFERRRYRYRSVETGHYHYWPVTRDPQLKIINALIKTQILTNITNPPGV